MVLKVRNLNRLIELDSLCLEFLERTFDVFEIDPFAGFAFFLIIAEKAAGFGRPVSKQLFQQFDVPIVTELITILSVKHPSL